MKFSEQTTLRHAVTLAGCGVHSGDPVTVTLHPAEADHGVAFLRTGLPGGRERLIEARYANVCATELCTVVGNAESGAVATIEHLMSALSGLGVDNVLVETDAAEMPILDGSAAPIVAAIDEAGLAHCGAPRRRIKVLKAVRVESGGAFCELKPLDRGFRLDVEIDFPSAVIGRSRRALDLTPQSYRREIARARTFGMMKDVERYWKAGFALGASLDNTVAIGDEGVVNPEGLRFADEFVRHKILDAVGDLALAGLPLVGAYRAHRGGHRLNVAVLAALFADRANYAVLEGGRREGGLADLGAIVPSAVFAPELG